MPFFRRHSSINLPETVLGFALIQLVGPTSAGT
jgi:hypothetical protein